LRPFGRPVPQQPWEEFARTTGISVVIDGAAGFEASIATPDLTIGPLPVALSFRATKTFSTGEGGAVVTLDTALAARVLQTINFGFYGTRDSQMASFNGKMSEYHAAVGLAELDRLELKWRRSEKWPTIIGQLMREEKLSDSFFGWPETSSNYALFLCRSSREVAAVEASLDHSGIDFRLWYGTGLRRHSYYREVARDELPNTESLAPRLIGLPVAPDLDEGQTSTHRGGNCTWVTMTAGRRFAADSALALNYVWL
jgi:dTDP-4-amino-4,6-dideoxygalactose transaminase